VFHYLQEEIPVAYNPIHRGPKAGFFRRISGNLLQKAEATFHSQKPGFSGFVQL
jgi:hypothetical protein